jgi:hypothetical protein
MPKPRKKAEPGAPGQLSRALKELLQLAPALSAMKTINDR